MATTPKAPTTPSDPDKPSLSALFANLRASADGLSAAEAQSRLTQYGFNELPEKKVNPFLKFLSYFWGPIPWMIEAAAILSAVVRHWEDFIIIAVLLFGNAVVGFWEEYQAGNAIAALKAQLALEARVKRDGAGGLEDWRLSDRDGRGSGGGADPCRGALPRRQNDDHFGVRSGADGGCHSSCGACRIVRHHGGGRSPACRQAGYRQSPGFHRRAGRNGCALLG